jgi:hypothetical protein
MESDEDQAAGPAVDLSPSGIVFAEPVEVTLPVDLSLLPFGTDIDEVRVLVIEEGVDPFVIDPVGFGEGSVTVSVTGFSICIPIVGVGPPALGLDPGGDEYWFLQWFGQFGSGSSDSRYRDMGVFVGEFSLFADGTFQHSANQRGTNWQNGDTGNNPPIDGTRNRYQQAQEGTLSWTYHSSGRSLVLSGGEEDLPTFLVSRDGRYMSGKGETVDDGEESFFVVKKHTGPVELDSVTGTWHLLLYEMGAGQDNATGAAYPGLNRAFGSFTFDGDGNCAIAFSARELEFQDGAFTQSFNSGTLDATYTVNEDGTLQVSIPVPDEVPEVFVLYPGDGLDAMVGQHINITDDPPVGLILVRQSANASRALLTGDYHGAEFAMDPDAYTTSTASAAHVGDYNVSSSLMSATFDGGASVDIAWNRRRIRRDSNEASGILVETELEEFPVSVGVTKQGKVTFNAGGGGLDGAVTRDGQVVVGISRPSVSDSDYGIHILMRAPPLNE